MLLSVPGGYDSRAPNPLLTGSLRLELLTGVCPIGLTHAGRPEVRVGSQDGRQVDSCGRLPGRRATLAGCRVALQGQRASSWEQEGSRGPLAVFSRKGGCQLEVKQ